MMLFSLLTTEFLTPQLHVSFCRGEPSGKSWSALLGSYVSPSWFHRSFSLRSSLIHLSWLLMVNNRPSHYWKASGQVSGMAQCPQSVGIPNAEHQQCYLHRFYLRAVNTDSCQNYFKLHWSANSDSTTTLGIHDSYFKCFYDYNIYLGPESCLLYEALSPTLSCSFSISLSSWTLQIYLKFPGLGDKLISTLIHLSTLEYSFWPW